MTPEDHMGDVIGDLNSRRGQINSFGDKPGGMKVSSSCVNSLASFISFFSCAYRSKLNGRD